MDTQHSKPSIWATGLAMFAMFFGAGNVVFPLVLGQLSLDQNFWGVLGMILTAVIVPLSGLMAMILYDGDYNKFFERVGKLPGLILIGIILAVIGPFAGIPRCITISYATLSPFLSNLPGVNLVTFGLFNVLVIFFLSVRPGKIIDLIGKVLTPILLVSLGVIVVKGFFALPHAGHSSLTRWQTFSEGFFSGYNTMDLLSTFFFSSIALLCLKEEGKKSSQRTLMKIAGIGGLIAGVLLTAFYVSFSYLAAAYASKLGGVEGHELLGSLAHQLLGPYAGLVVAVAVFFACVTTQIALAAAASRFLSETVTQKRLPYNASLGLILFISFFVSTLNFNGIAAFLGPILQLCYPALMVLVLLNILHKMWKFQPVKLFFYATLVATVAIKFF